mmetsp:Transcript_5859/g.7924  ORF Transcript_5859/g.7924 Transcript_5859/m.7924 type:complete len:159 (+) Transcript_5859:13-489(+)
MTTDYRRQTKAQQMEQLLRDSGDEDSNDGAFDQSLLQPTEKTPDAASPKRETSTPTVNAKEQLSYLLREQKALQDANRLTSDYFKRGPAESNDRQRGRTKSPIGTAGLNQTLSKFKSIDLNLIQALGNKRQNGQSRTDLARSASSNVLPPTNNEDGAN